MCCPAVLGYVLFALSGRVSRFHFGSREKGPLLEDPVAMMHEHLSQEVEARLAGCLQRGAALEADVLTAVAGLLPADVQQQLPSELKDVLLRGTVTGQVATEPMVYEEADYMPTTTVAANQTGASAQNLHRQCRHEQSLCRHCWTGMLVLPLRLGEDCIAAASQGGPR